MSSFFWPLTELEKHGFGPQIPLFHSRLNMNKLGKNQESKKKKAVYRLLLGVLIGFPQSYSALAEGAKQLDSKGFSNRNCKELFSNLDSKENSLLLNERGMNLVLAREHPSDKQRDQSITAEDKQAPANKKSSVSGHSSQRANSRSSVSEIYSIVNAQAKTRGEAFFARQLTEREAQALVNLTSPIWKERAAYLEDNRQGTHPERARQKPLALTEDQAWMLKQAGFSEREIERILSAVSVESGLSQFLPDLEAPQTALAKRIQEGKPLSPGEEVSILVSGLENYVARVVKFDGPGKIIIEFPNPETGGLSKMTINDMAFIETREGRGNIYEKVKNWPEQEESFAHNVSFAETKVFSEKYGIIKFDPKTRQIFSAYQSDRKILSMEELNLQAMIPTEPDSSNIEGSSHPEIQEQIAFARALRKLAIPPHPHNTHIEWLALKIPSIIEYARKILAKVKEEHKKAPCPIFLRSFLCAPVQELSVPDIIEQTFSAIKDLEEQAMSAIQKKEVSYVWWLTFNHNLANLVSMNRIPRRGQIPDQSRLLSKAVAHFPYRLTLPINVWEGELKEEILSMAVLNDVRPVVFSSNGRYQVEMLGGSSAAFMEHDFTHLNIADDPFNPLKYGRASPLSVFHDLGHHQFVKTSGLFERWIKEEKPSHRLYHPPFVYNLLNVYD